MNPVYQNLFNEMQHDINRCLKLPHSETENAERCFWIAKNYWERLKKFVMKNEFMDTSQEIEFFRDIKPQFTVFIEYFVILSEALQFVPAKAAISKNVTEFFMKGQSKTAIAENCIEYWENEAKRFKRFCDKHREFIEYYESGKQSNDRKYFLRENDNGSDLAPTSLYDMDKSFTTSYERLVRSYLANKKYWEYCKERFVESKALLGKR